jgi:hypothetical protein
MGTTSSSTISCSKLAWKILCKFPYSKAFFWKATSTIHLNTTPMSQLLRQGWIPRAKAKYFFFDMLKKYILLFFSKKIILWKKMKHLLKYSGIFYFLIMESSKLDSYSTETQWTSYSTMVSSLVWWLIHAQNSSSVLGLRQLFFLLSCDL